MPPNGIWSIINPPQNTQSGSSSLTTFANKWPFYNFFFFFAKKNIDVDFYILLSADGTSGLVVLFFKVHWTSRHGKDI